jgi:hypothetical protein
VAERYTLDAVFNDLARRSATSKYVDGMATLQERPAREKNRKPPNELNRLDAMKSNRWTPQARERQAKLIHQWQPWKQSTGPKTAEGKVAVSRNAYKGGTRPMLRTMARTLREQQRVLEDLRECFLD